jgi:hypothetical protein
MLPLAPLLLALLITNGYDLARRCPLYEFRIGHLLFYIAWEHPEGFRELKHEQARIVIIE